MSERVVIGTPCYGAVCGCGFVHGLMECSVKGLLGAWIACEKESLVSRARNQVAESFLGLEMDWLLWVDADIVFEASHVAGLLEVANRTGERLVCGQYRLKTENTVSYVWSYPLERVAADVQRVRFAGTGFMLVHREVFMEIVRLGLAEKITVGPKAYYDFHPVGVVDGRYESEDYGFCRLAAEAGHGPVVAEGVTVGHMGMKLYA